jgi:membrane-associated phospholipid phosphatase
MNQFDYTLLLWMNQVADGYPIFTKIMIDILGDVLKTSFIAALLWWAWFGNEGSVRQREVRERIAACLVASVACIIVVRLGAALLPFRLRPLANSTIALHFPLEVGDWGNWSAFPSDNAVMFSMLATCLFTISRPLGIIAALDVAFLICFPRVFLGIHHPTDVFAGAFIGIVAGWLTNRAAIRRRLSMPIFALMDWHPAVFYANAFMITFLLALVYWPITRLVISSAKLARILLASL